MTYHRLYYFLPIFGFTHKECMRGKTVKPPFMPCCIHRAGHTSSSSARKPSSQVFPDAGSSSWMVMYAVTLPVFHIWWFPTENRHTCIHITRTRAVGAPLAEVAAQDKGCNFVNISVLLDLTYTFYLGNRQLVQRVVQLSVGFLLQNWNNYSLMSNICAKYQSRDIATLLKNINKIF